MQFSSALALRIKTLCHERKISIHKLSEMSGLPESTVRSFINGKVKAPRFDTIYKISTGLGLTLAEFFDFKEMNEIGYFED